MGHQGLQRVDLLASQGTFLYLPSPHWPGLGPWVLQGTQGTREISQQPNHLLLVQGKLRPEVVIWE